jgi:hypothetical protein
MVVSAPVSAVTRKVTTVPSGIFAAAILTVTAPLALMTTSGLKYWPEACGGTGTPFTCVMMSEGWLRVELAGGRNKGPWMKDPVVTPPVKAFALVLKRMIP